MRKRVISALLALCMVLTFFPKIPAYATNVDILPEKTGVAIEIEANATKSLAFIPESTGLYVFSFVGTDYMDNQLFGESAEYFQITDSTGSQLECIYRPGDERNYPNWDKPHMATESNDYIVQLQSGTTYTFQYRNPKNETDELVAIASPICSVGGSPMSSIVIPGYGALTKNGVYNSYEYTDSSGKLDSSTNYSSYLDVCLAKITISQDGWYSFGSGSHDLTQMGGSGVISIYTTELQPIAERYYAMNYSEADPRVPASFYFIAGDYVIAISDSSRGVSIDAEFAGKQSSFLSVSADSSPVFVNVEVTENYVTFTPSKTDTYTVYSVVTGRDLSLLTYQAENWGKVLSPKWNFPKYFLGSASLGQWSR